MRLGWLALTAVVIAGCESLKENPSVTSGTGVVSVADAREASAAVPVAAIAPVAQDSGLAVPGAASPDSLDDPLTLAAECLERGDQPAAVTHLDAYVRLHPEQIMFRAHLAELLLKLDRLEESKRQFEEFIFAAQEATGPPRSHLVHCHTRLMEIGQREDDGFDEAFHRGVGLLLLMKQQEAASDRPDGGMMEEILCKALAALHEAKELQPEDSRVHFYLAEAYDRAGNRRAADVARAAARNHAFHSSVTPQEHRRLSLRGCSARFR